MADYFEQATAPTSGFGVAMAGAVRKDKAADRAGADAAIAVPQVNSAGSLRVTHDGGLARYVATSAFTCDSTATDIFYLPGSASKTVKLERLIIAGVATAAATGRLQVIRRSAANTAGTAVASGLGAASTDDITTGTPNATAVPKHYTAHPTSLGTANGVLFTTQYGQQAVGTVAIDRLIIDFRTATGGKGIRLSGTSDLVAVNVAAALGGSGNIWDITAEFTEEPTTA